MSEVVQQEYVLVDGVWFNLESMCVHCFSLKAPQLLPAESKQRPPENHLIADDRENELLPLHPSVCKYLGANEHRP